MLTIHAMSWSKYLDQYPERGFVHLVGHLQPGFVCVERHQKHCRFHCHGPERRGGERLPKPRLRHRFGAFRAVFRGVKRIFVRHFVHHESAGEGAPVGQGFYKRPDQRHQEHDRRGGRYGIGHRFEDRVLPPLFRTGRGAAV